MSKNSRKMPERLSDFECCAGIGIHGRELDESLFEEGKPDETGGLITTEQVSDIPPFYDHGYSNPNMPDF